MEVFSRTVLFGLFVCVPLRATTESEEDSPTEWTMWKRTNRVSYEAEVSVINT